MSWTYTSRGPGSLSVTPGIPACLFTVISSDPTRIVTFFTGSFALSSVIMGMASAAFYASTESRPGSARSFPGYTGLPATGTPPVDVPVFFAALPDPLGSYLVTSAPFYAPSISVLMSVVARPSTTVYPPPGCLEFGVSFDLSLWTYSSSLEHIFVSVVFLFS